MNLSSAYLDTMRLEADPPADAVIARIAEAYGPHESRKIFDQLISDIGIPGSHLPAEVIDFFESHSLLPDWADPARIMKGQEVFANHGPMLMTLLYFKALPTTYCCHRGANVLFLTGRMTRSELDKRRFSRRIAETAQFVVDVMTPGNLLPGGKGIVSAMKVRLIHASVRNFIPAASWNTAEWGKPVNQEDLAGTLMSFSALMLEGLEQSKKSPGPENSENYMYAWRVVGHFLGIRPELSPKTAEEGQGLMSIIFSRQAGESEAGKVLTQSLLNFVEELIPGKLFDQAPALLLRYFCGLQIANVLGVSYKPGCMTRIFPSALGSIFGIVGELDRKKPGFDEIIRKVNLALLNGMVDFFNPDKKTAFQVSPELLKKWRSR